MPRLSIIIAHRNDQQLEDTILSVLENRPRDCEIIVAHDGSYHDPYELVDEVVYIQEEHPATVVELLNAGLMAACSPVVCALLDGVVVSADWAEPALKRFARSEVAAVAPQLQVGKSRVSGIAEEAICNQSKLRGGRVESKDNNAAAPTIAAGFYRRKIMSALGGWNDEISAASADVELAFLMSKLALTCECEPQVVVKAMPDAIPSRTSRQVISELAGIAAAHGIASASLGNTISSIIKGTLTGSLSSALAWSSGLSNAEVTLEVIERLKYAQKRQGVTQDPTSLKFQVESGQSRRAA